MAADLVLDLAMVLVVVIVLWAIPRMMAANEETLAALHRRRPTDEKHPVRSLPAQLPDEQRRTRQPTAQRAA